MEDGKPTAKKTAEMCTILAIDRTNLFYRACFICDSPFPENPSNSLCQHCSRQRSNSADSFASKRLFRILISIATDQEVITVICFDRAARVIFGCSADQFFNFAKLHPSAAAATGRILEGEMFKMTLSKPKSEKAQHLRATSIRPLRTGYRTVIESLQDLYKSNK